jgi:hypothetical protein
VGRFFPRCLLVLAFACTGVWLADSFKDPKQGMPSSGGGGGGGGSLPAAYMPWGSIGALNPVAPKASPPPTAPTSPVRISGGYSSTMTTVSASGAETVTSSAMRVAVSSPVASVARLGLEPYTPPGAPPSSASRPRPPHSLDLLVLVVWGVSAHSHHV